MSRSVKGLLIKDFVLMKSQNKFFFCIMILWGIFMASSLNMTFFVGYIAILGSFMVPMTLNYDEFENGSAYLLTLPISRKDYIFSKYLFGVLLTVIPFATASILSWIVLVVQGTEMNLLEYIASVAVSLPLAFLLLVLEIPLQVKFGQEKSRIISFILIGCLSFSFGMFSYLNEWISADGTGAAGGTAGFGTGILVLLAAAALVVLLLLISYKISCLIMEKKQF